MVVFLSQVRNVASRLAPDVHLISVKCAAYIEINVAQRVENIILLDRSA